MSIKLPKELEENLRKKQYGIYNHSAVQICTWTKKALINKGVCYKKKFYNVDTHSCMEFSPVSMWCSQNCIFCWRPMEYMKLKNFKDEDLDDPKDIVENLIKERKKLLSGFGGNSSVNKELLKDAIIPTHYAISLSGEPTLYPKIGELVKYLKSMPKTKSIFIVSNAQEVDIYKKFLENKDLLPTQFYVSLDAPNKEIFKKVNRSVYKDGWERLLKSLEIFSQFKTRKVIRFTLIKDLNDKDEFLSSYRNLIEISKTDFIEIKAYMHIGMSQKRLKKENMPTHNYIKKFAEKLDSILENYEIIDEMEASRIVLLRRKDSPYKEQIEKFENE